MHIVYRQTCRICGSSHLAPVIDLGEQYLQGSFVKPGYPTPPQRKVPTQLVRCDVSKNEGACGLLQLAHTLPSEILYANYWYRSGTNQTMRTHLKGIVDSALSLVPAGNCRVLDIGCNDGTLLSFYPQSFDRWGVDPSDIAREIKPPVTVVSSTFPSQLLEDAVGLRKFDIISSIAMYYDLESPVGFAKAIKGLLSEDGIWIVEMSYLPLMLRQNSFDTICHEHLEYYSLAVLEYIAQQSGLRVFRAVLNDVNGGSIRLYLTHAGNGRYDSVEDKALLSKLRMHEFELELDTNKPYIAFQQRIDKVRSDISAFMSECRSAGKVVHIYGASTKGNVLLQWCQIDSTVVKAAADRNQEKHGARTLGTNIPIISEEQSRAERPDYYLVLPWHFKAEFLARERATIEAGTAMIFPLPDLSVVTALNIDVEIERASTCNLLSLFFA